MAMPFERVLAHTARIERRLDDRAQARERAMQKARSR